MRPWILGYKGPRCSPHRHTAAPAWPVDTGQVGSMDSCCCRQIVTLQSAAFSDPPRPFLSSVYSPGLSRSDGHAELCRGHFSVARAAQPRGLRRLSPLCLFGRVMKAATVARGSLRRGAVRRGAARRSPPRSPPRSFPVAPSSSMYYSRRDQRALPAQTRRSLTSANLSSGGRGERRRRGTDGGCWMWSPDGEAPRTVGRALLVPARDCRDRCFSSLRSE